MHNFGKFYQLVLIIWQRHIAIFVLVLALDFIVCITSRDGLHKQIKATTKLTHLWSICSVAFNLFLDLSGSNECGPHYGFPC